MAMEVDVAIVGGGMAGLALGIGLRSGGIQAHIFEKSPQKRKHFGTGMSIGENGFQALEGIKAGLGEKVGSVGQLTSRFTQRIRIPGEEEKVVVQLPQRAESNRLYAITWRAAYDVLLDEFQSLSGVVHYEHAFLDYKRVSEEGVEVRFEVKSTAHDGNSLVKAKLLIGADGVWSAVRKLVIGDEPRDLNLVTWYCNVPTDTIRDLDLVDDDEIRFILYPATTTSIILCYCGSGISHWSYRVPDESGEVRKSLPADLQAHGQEARMMRLLQQREINTEGLRNLKEAMQRSEGAQIREDHLFDRPPVSSWSDSTKRVVLVGDAAHGLYPGPGLGARMAFEDAHELTPLLHKAFSGQITLVEAIERFEDIRIPRCRKVHGYAAEMTTFPCHIPQWVQELPPIQRNQRVAEFYRWVNQFPANVDGDPTSTYWKP